MRKNHNNALRRANVRSRRTLLHNCKEKKYWTVLSSPCHSLGFLASRSIDNSIAKSIHFSIKSFMRS